MGDAVIVFCGSFNPPTIGHLNALVSGYNFLKDKGYNVLKCIMIPASSGYNKPGLVPGMERVEMCRLASKDIDFIDVDSVEAQKDTWSRTIDTLEYLQAKSPQARHFILCGIDLVEKFETKWRKPDIMRFLEEFGFVILPRFGEEIQDITKHCSYFIGKLEHVYILDYNPFDMISSTVVRNEIQAGHRICSYVSPLVEQFILSKGYYK